MELDPYAVPGAAAGAIALTQFIKVMWSAARAVHMRIVAALSGLGIVVAIQWDAISGGGAAAVVGLLLSGITAGLAASATFDLGKAIKSGD